MQRRFWKLIEGSEIRYTDGMSLITRFSIVLDYGKSKVMKIPPVNNARIFFEFKGIDDSLVVHLLDEVV